MPRSRLAELVAVIEKLGAQYNLQVGLFGHAGDGNMHPTVLTDERDKEEIERVERFFDEVYEATIEMGGTITGEHGVGLAKRKYLPRMVNEQALKTMQAVKKALDPNGVLNPGKIFTLDGNAD